MRTNRFGDDDGSFQQGPELSIQVIEFFAAGWAEREKMLRQTANPRRWRL
jgi:hypothetical protein